MHDLLRSTINNLLKSKERVAVRDIIQRLYSASNGQRCKMVMCPGKTSAYLHGLCLQPNHKLTKPILTTKRCIASNTALFASSTGHVAQMAAFRNRVILNQNSVRNFMGFFGKGKKGDEPEQTAKSTSGKSGCQLSMKMKPKKPEGDGSQAKSSSAPAAGGGGSSGKKPPCPKPSQSASNKKDDGPCSKKTESPCPKPKSPCPKKEASPCPKPKSPCPKPSPCPKKEASPCPKPKSPCPKKEENPCAKSNKPPPCPPKPTCPPPDPCAKKENPCNKKSKSPCAKQEPPPCPKPCTVKMPCPKKPCPKAPPKPPCNAPCVVKMPCPKPSPEKGKGKTCPLRKKPSDPCLAKGYKIGSETHGPEEEPKSAPPKPVKGQSKQEPCRVEIDPWERELKNRFRCPCMSKPTCDKKPDFQIMPKEAGCFYNLPQKTPRCPLQPTLCEREKSLQNKPKGCEASPSKNRDCRACPKKGAAPMKSPLCPKSTPPPKTKSCPPKTSRPRPSCPPRKPC